MPSIDDLSARIPRLLKWCFAAMGGVTGWYYANASASPIPLSYVAAGATIGFCALRLVFVVLMRLKDVAIICLVMLVINYAILVPYGFGDHVAGWLQTGEAIARALSPARLIQRWGKSVEVRP